MTYSQEVQIAVLSGLVTALAAILAVLYTQWRSDRRASQTRADAKELQDVEWRRQEATRAHATFLKKADELFHMVTLYTRVGEGQDLPDELAFDWDRDLRRALVAVEMFGSVETAERASELAGAVKRCETGTVGAIMEADLAMEESRRAVQADLGLAITRLESKWATGELDRNPAD